MHSVEAVLDDDTDGLIRSQWAALADAGLPSQTRHPWPTNRPHVTLALATTLGQDCRQALVDAASALPVAITVGGLLLFGTRRYVLARSVVPSVDLLRLQAGVRAALNDEADPHEHFRSGRWTPHITLGRRLTQTQVAEALEVLGELPAAAGALVRARRWDMTAKKETWVPQAATYS